MSSPPIRTMIVDDEPLARRNISALLKADPETVVVGECSSGTEAIEAIRTIRPELLFLDIQMPGCDGFDVLEQLGAGAAPKAVIFVTAYDQYALKAFEAAAVDYLLKPFDNVRFARALDRAKAIVRGSKGQPDVIVVKSAGRVTVLKATEIDWIEAADYYACLHVGPRTHLLRRSMADLEQELDPAAFCRIHRSVIVNLARVLRMEIGTDGEYG
ncbi:MAG TPA: response regulator transcription factor, partial [Bryobacteraceae bacterium]